MLGDGAILKAYPKAKPLALALVKAAAAQGATVEEFAAAYNLAERHLNRALRKASVAKFNGQVKTEIQGLKEVDL